MEFHVFVSFGKASRNAYGIWRVFKRDTAAAKLFHAGILSRSRQAIRTQVQMTLKRGSDQDRAGAIAFGANDGIKFQAIPFNRSVGNV